MATDTADAFLKVRVDLPAAFADPACGVLMYAGAQGVELRDGETMVAEGEAIPADGRAHVIAWLAVDTDPESFAATVCSQLETDDVDIEFETVAAEDWVRKVREQIEPVEIGRVLIRPSWDDARARDDQIEIVLDPGLAFGTGGHPTTALCLAVGSELVDGWRDHGRAPSVLDVGTGSGILCIASVKLGAGRAIGIDNDPTAIDVARENAFLNEVSERCEFTSRPPGAHNGVFDLVFANIQLGVLETLAPDIAPRVAPLGDLLLSGLLPEQADAAEHAYRAQGLVPRERRVVDGWALCHLVRDR